MTTKYVISARYGRPKLTKIEVEKETPRMLWLSGHTNIMGSMYLSDRLHKEKYETFDDPEDAVKELMRKMTKVKAGYVSQIRDVNTHLESLTELLDELRDADG